MKYILKLDWFQWLPIRLYTTFITFKYRTRPFCGNFPWNICDWCGSRERFPFPHTWFRPLFRRGIYSNCWNHFLLDFKWFFPTFILGYPSVVLVLQFTMTRAKIVKISCRFNTFLMPMAPFLPPIHENYYNLYKCVSRLWTFS